MSRAKNTVPVEGPSPGVDSAVERLEHVGGTRLLAAVHGHQLLKVIDKTDRTVREGGGPWCRLDRISGVSGA